MNQHDEPAFPLCVPDTNKDYYTHDGMALRDYFAAKAMIAEMTGPIASLSEVCKSLGINSSEYDETIHYKKYIASEAYKWADAMLEARAAK
jgi:hypothetical protein